MKKDHNATLSAAALKRYRKYLAEFNRLSAIRKKYGYKKLTITEFAQTCGVTHQRMSYMLRKCARLDVGDAG